MTRLVSLERDRPPGAWVTEQATRRSRLVWLLVLALVIVAATSFALALSPHKTISGGAGLLALVLVLRVLAERKTETALRWRRGATAERSVGETLNLLRDEGYTVLHDVEQAGEGNIDHIVSGPNGVYLIETKARSYRNEHLVKAKRQAAKLHDKLGVWVTPVICLHQRTGEAWRHDRVWIVPQPSLLDWIRAQRDTPAPREQLDHFAARS